MAVIFKLQVLKMENYNRNIFYEAFRSVPPFLSTLLIRFLILSFIVRVEKGETYDVGIGIFIF